MNLFNYLMTKKGHNTSVRDDLFAYLLGKKTSREVKTATGTTISISDVTREKIVSLTLSKESTQETTTGKNLFDTRKTSITSNGVVFTPNNDGSITIKGTSTAALNVTLVNTNNPPVLPAGTYIKSIKVVGTITKNSNHCFLTGRDNNKNNVLKDTDVVSNMTTSNVATLEEEHTMTSIGLWSNEGGIVFDCTIYIQIEEGSTATEWEKYTGGQPSPNPDYPQEIKTVTGNVEITITDGTNTRNYTIPLGNNEIVGKGINLDELIINKHGQCFINKKFAKIDSYNGETITTDYWSTTGGLDTGSTIYYVLATSQLIDLNYTVDIELFNGVNNISNSDDMDMILKYY